MKASMLHDNDKTNYLPVLGASRHRGNRKLSILGSEYLLERYGPSPMFSLQGHIGCVNSALFSECGNYVFTGSDDTQVNVYNLHTGLLEESISTAHAGNIFFAKDLPNTQGATLLSCAADGRVILMDRISRKNRVIFRHKGRAHRIGLIPHCADSFVSCGEDGMCCLFDIRDSRHSMFEGQSAAELGNESESGRSIVNKITFMDGLSKKCPIYCVSTNPLRPYQIVLGGSTSHLSLYDTRNFGSPVAYLCPQSIVQAKRSCHVTGTKFNYSGESVVASYNDEAVYTMQVSQHSVPQHRAASGRKRSRDRSGLQAEDSSEPSDSSEGGETSQSSEERGYSIRFAGHRNSDTVKQVTYLGGRSEFVASGSDCGHIFIWSAENGKLLKVLKGDQVGAVNCLSGHPTLPFLASSGLEHDAKIWGPTGEHLPLSEGSLELANAKRIIERNETQLSDSSMGFAIDFESRTVRTMLSLLMSPVGRRVFAGEDNSLSRLLFSVFPGFRREDSDEDEDEDGGSTYIMMRNGGDDDEEGEEDDEDDGHHGDNEDDDDGEDDADANEDSDGEDAGAESESIANLSSGDEDDESDHEEDYDNDVSIFPGETDSVSD